MKTHKGPNSTYGYISYLIANSITLWTNVICDSDMIEHPEREVYINLSRGFYRIGYPQPYLPKKNFVAQGPPNWLWAPSKDFSDAFTYAFAEQRSLQCSPRTSLNYSLLSHRPSLRHFRAWTGVGKGWLSTLIDISGVLWISADLRSVSMTSFYWLMLRRTAYAVHGW